MPARDRRNLPLGVEQLPSQHHGHPPRVTLRGVGKRSCPSCIHGFDEQGEPAIEVLDLERFEPVYVPMRSEDVPVVTRLAEQDAAPVPDEPRNVHGPIDLGYFVEDGRENVIEDNLPIEADDKIVDLRNRVEITRRVACAVGGHRERCPTNVTGRTDTFIVRRRC